MLSLQSDPRQVQQLQQQQQQTARVSYNNGDHQRESSYLLSTETAPTSSNATLKLSQGLESREATEDMLMSVAHQSYKTGDFRQALDHSKAVYDRNPMRLDNLLLLGAIYYQVSSLHAGWFITFCNQSLANLDKTCSPSFQLHDFDMCIAKNEEALCIDRNFAECYGNMANAWKEKGNIDVAIRYYLVAIELRPNFADAWSNLGNAYMRKGRLSEAAQCCRQALSLNPHLVDAHSNLGNLMKAQGLMQEAYSCYLEALHIQPTFAIAWSNLAGLFMESGDLSRALQYYKEAVKLKPTFSDAYLNLGNVYKALGMAAEAIVCYQRALQSKPDYAMAFGNLASIFYEQGSLEMAINHYKQAIACDAGFLEAYNNLVSLFSAPILGNALKDAGKVEEAIHCYRQCLSLQPSHPQALTNLGNIYMEWYIGFFTLKYASKLVLKEMFVIFRNMMTAAVQCYKATLSVTTGLSAPFNNLAIIYKQQGNYADAISCYNEVLRIDPLAADGLVNRGNTYKEIGRVNEAVQDYSRAIVIRPNMAEAHANLASAYKDSGNVEAAIKSYRQALAIRPDFPEATCNLLHTLQCVCDWDDRTRMFVEVDGVLRRQIKTSVIPSVQPFHAIAYPLDPVLALEISRKYASHCSVIASRFSLPAFNHPLPLPIKVSGGNKRLKIGYVSSDFGNHPLSHLMGSVFGMHNRENIEVFCYALSPNDGSEWRIRIQSEAEHFKDVSAMTSDMIARLINEDQIQILVNLNGYTKGARNEIFAMQPAPIQVSYMGFPGTTGANYIQYLVTDEKNLDVLDPNCQPKRSAYGLPDDKFIFACFNQLYKMDPEIFMHWCNILKRVPNSALWLLRFPAAGEMRLRACMPLCNAHTTGTDVLWAGLPMVTLPLEKMATRVAGSLCLATGVGEEMIANSMKEYEERAVSLALNPSKLQDLTKRLKSARLTCPLFDTSRWVTNLERSYMKMWNLHCDGRQPHHFKVKENDSDYPYDR
ncbi:Tetratricopeptide-like helical [Cynara cardunculus var. scolymus]|uniref:protein O-GlcNAc transferase n=1 Tax=Cynara cardunculus var. scolymus TaxID=59895 RepID=A0A118JZT7_CYNCS|nr:Tetratricopeptide-like helical [Cynara cardunculus var. scolymus]